MQAHGYHSQLIAHTVPSIPQYVSDASVPLEAGIAVFHRYAAARQGMVECPLFVSQFVFRLAFLFALPLEREYRLRLPDPQSDEAAVQTNGYRAMALDVLLVNDLLVMIPAGVLVTD